MEQWWAKTNFHNHCSPGLPTGKKLRMVQNQNQGATALRRSWVAHSPPNWAYFWGPCVVVDWTPGKILSPTLSICTILLAGSCLGSFNVRRSLNNIESFHTHSAFFSSGPVKVEGIGPMKRQFKAIGRPSRASLEQGVFRFESFRFQMGIK